MHFNYANHNVGKSEKKKIVLMTDPTIRHQSKTINFHMSIAYRYVLQLLFYNFKSSVYVRTTEPTKNYIARKKIYEKLSFFLLE